jgi:quercetin dioxygenase-like cupin family protein|tara:strand:+ start:68 stop:658 length:591 start_codon:yes stop_codon:yes gene_type:complete
MISLFNKNNPLAEEKNSLFITYPRTVNIIFGHYPYPDLIHNFMMDVKNNLNPKMENYTNVKGGMTDWNYFVNKSNFINFMTFLINKHQTTHADIFEHFLEKNTIENAWGNEIKKGDSLDYHIHPDLHGILYLTKGCDLILPELNLKINPEPGDYYIFPPHILHGFDTSQEEKNRYSLIFNISQHKHFDYKKKLNER